MADTNDKQNLNLININDIDNLYNNISISNKLHLSPNIKFKHLGGSWRAIQFICSWQREHGDVSIILNRQVNINKLDFKSEVHLVSFYLAKEVFLDDQDIRQELLKKFIPFVKNMNHVQLYEYLKQNRGRRHKFLFLHDTRNEFSRLFYNDNKQLKSKQEIECLIGDILKATNSAISKNQYHENLDEIKEIIYELLSNTDKHGRRDIGQVEIHKNTRGFSLDFYDFNDKNRESFLNKSKEYSRFLQNVTEVLVISIFDSGEGIVKKYIETTSVQEIENINFEGQKKILSDVFLPNVTSSIVPNSGMGLTYVKENLEKLKGLLSLKTNNLELFFTPNENGKYTKSVTEHSPCVGTSVVMLIPLKFKK